MNEIVKTYILSLEMHLPTQDTLALIKKIVGTYKEVPFYIQPFSGNAWHNLPAIFIEGDKGMDQQIEETLSLSPLFVTLSEDEKNILIQKIISHLEYTPDKEKTVSGYISL